MSTRGGVRPALANQHANKTTIKNQGRGTARRVSDAARPTQALARPTERTSCMMPTTCALVAATEDCAADAVAGKHFHYAVLSFAIRICGNGMADVANACARLDGLNACIHGLLRYLQQFLTFF